VTTPDPRRTRTPRTNVDHVLLAKLLPERLVPFPMAADALGLSPDALRALLRRHPSLAEPRYSRLGRAPRLYRLLTTAEVRAIGLFLIQRCLPAYPGRGTLGSPTRRGPQAQGSA
jgi:hypothetical protein